MPDHCAYPNCKKELVHTEGRRKKKYCNQNCNTRHWQMLHPKPKGKTKRISAIPDEKGLFTLDGKKVKLIWEKATPESFNEDQINPLVADELGLTKYSPIIPPDNKDQNKEVSNEAEKQRIETRIKELEKEINNPPIKFSSLIAKQAYFFDRRKELQKLKASQEEM